MGTTTARNASAASLKDVAGRRAGLIRRVFATVVASRSRHAEQRLASHLAAMSEQRLEALGFSATEIGSIRAGEPVGNILARRA
jgi:hypothetical protein